MLQIFAQVIQDKRENMAQKEKMEFQGQGETLVIGDQED